MTSILANSDPDTADLTDDAFLGGRLQLLQPRKGYRAGMDPVLLAASVPARPGQRVLDLGCGVGTAAFCLIRRVPGLALTGIERQPAYAALAGENAHRNGIDLRVLTGDIRGAGQMLSAEDFDHVICNPPFFDPNRRTPAGDPGREAGLAEDTPLADWIDTAARRLRPKGFLHMIHRAERLPDILSSCSHRLGSLEVLPLAPRAGRAAHLILVRARKAGRAAFRLHAPAVLHAGGQHQRDGDDYVPAISAVLRDGQPLPWPSA